MHRTLTLKTLSTLVDGFLHQFGCQSSNVSHLTKVDASRHGRPQCQRHFAAFDELVMVLHSTMVNEAVLTDPPRHVIVRILPNRVLNNGQWERRLQRDQSAGI